MNFKQFVNQISVFKTKELGGLDAQFKLAPELRLKYNANKIVASNPRKAAVLALFYPNEKNETCFLLTERASYKGTHSAQISFPGGKIEKTDKNIQETALRETFEEVGVVVSDVEMIREMTNVFIPPSNFLVTPFIGFIEEKPEFILNHEVANSIEVLLSDLLDDRSISTENLSTSYMKNIVVPCFKLKGYVVWGATAMILSEIKELLKL